MLVSGSSGADMKEWVRLMVSNFSFPHIKVMYPTAPLQPYTPAGGQMSQVWFDRADISNKVPEVSASLAKIEVEVKNLIKQENDAGIPTNRIIVGKFMKVLEGLKKVHCMCVTVGTKWYHIEVVLRWHSITV